MVCTTADCDLAIAIAIKGAGKNPASGIGLRRYSRQDSLDCRNWFLARHGLAPQRSDTLPNRHPVGFPGFRPAQLSQSLPKPRKGWIAEHISLLHLPQFKLLGYWQMQS